MCVPHWMKAIEYILANVTHLSEIIGDLADIDLNANTACSAGYEIAKACFKDKSTDGDVAGRLIQEVW